MLTSKARYLVVIVGEATNGGARPSLKQLADLATSPLDQQLYNILVPTIISPQHQYIEVDTFPTASRRLQPESEALPIWSVKTPSPACKHRT